MLNDNLQIKNTRKEKNLNKSFVHAKDIKTIYLPYNLQKCKTWYASILAVEQLTFLQFIQDTNQRKEGLSNTFAQDTYSPM